MTNAIMLLAALPLLAGLLLAERGGRTRQVLVVKSALSCLFVLAALMQPHPLPGYAGLVLAGLVLGLIGDVCLALPGQTAFRLGLLAFLAGHLLYVAAFLGLAAPAAWGGPAPLVIALAGVLVFLWLRPRAGKLLIPVAAYILAISLMLSCAWAVFQTPGLPVRGVSAVLLGALLFYLSDLCVARDRFVSPGFINRLLGLPLYYAGQFLLAFSVGWLG